MSVATVNRPARSKPSLLDGIDRQADQLNKRRTGNAALVSRLDTAERTFLRPLRPAFCDGRCRRQGQEGASRL
jgi:hypothetical protein